MLRPTGGTHFTRGALWQEIDQLQHQLSYANATRMADW